MMGSIADMRVRAVTEPSLEKIIERLQSCLVEAREMQLTMLERVLSISLLEAHQLKEKTDKGWSNGPH